MKFLKHIINGPEDLPVEYQGIYHGGFYLGAVLVGIVWALVEIVF